MTIEDHDAKVQEIVATVALILKGFPHYAVKSIMESATDKLSGLCLLTDLIPSSAP